MPSASPARIVVVGGGVAGLVAARRLALSGHDVTVCEAGDRLGGHVHTVTIAGLPVDVGAEAVHLLNPAARALVDDLGLGDDVVASRSGTSWLWTPRGRRTLPAGVGPAGPTRLWPVLTSRVMSTRGLLRAGLEPVVTRVRGPVHLTPENDMSVGEFVTSRFGAEVTRRFVDPLLGGLHSGDVDRLGMFACAPALVGAAREGRSLVFTRKKTNPSPGSAAPQTASRPPVAFGSWPQGMTTLVRTLTDHATAHGARVRLRTPVLRLERLRPAGQATSGSSRAGATGGAGDAPSPAPARGYRVHVGGEHPEILDADAVVLAVPAPVAAALVADVAPAAAAPLTQTRLASTAAVVLGFDAADVADVAALDGNGMLVPSDTDSLLKAATFLTSKWPHLRGGHTTLVRLSAGRAGQHIVEGMDDATLVDHLRRDLRRFTGLDAAPTHVYVHRWATGLPQLTVGHTQRMTHARTQLAEDAPGVVLAGASYDGVGLTSVLPSGERAAAAVSSFLGD